MAYTKQQDSTIEDIYKLSEVQTAELIAGQIYVMPPNTTHQRILHYLDRTKSNYIQDKQGDCEAFPALVAVFLNVDDKTYLESDISVICERNKINEKRCNYASE